MGFSFFVIKSFIFSDVGALVIIHKRNQSNLTIGQRGKQKLKKKLILLYFGNLLEPII
jgi:hypothetical protein